MSQALDPRIVRATITIDGKSSVYQSIGDDGFYIASTGTKYANPQQNEAEIKIANLTKADRDYLLTATSPFNLNRTPKTILLEAGRVSTGTTKVFQGNITFASPSQPPDIVLTFKCLTGQYLNGQIVSAQQPSPSPLSGIAKSVADSTGLNLNFQAADKQISNYGFAGGALKQVDKLGDAGGVNAYVDDDQLVVKDVNAPLTGVLRILNEQSGMIGIPEITQFGVKATMLLDGQTRLGGALQIESVIYPTVNGRYVIFTLGWNISSREDPFYWIADSIRHTDAGQTIRPPANIRGGGRGRK